MLEKFSPAIEKLMKFGPAITALFGLLSPIASPAVAHFWTAHGQLAIIVGSVMTALAAFAPQPHK